MKNAPAEMIDRRAPRVGVGLMVVDDSNCVLLTLRARPPEAGCWSILGGRVELFEPLEACAVREAREEAAIDVVVERLLCVTDHIIPEEEDHWVSPAYLGRIVGGHVRNAEPEKAREVAWFPVGALPPNLTITARNAIATYVRLAGGTDSIGPLGPTEVAGGAHRKP